VEACKWLRAAGFPQYAQMYEGKCEPHPPPQIAPYYALPFCAALLKKSLEIEEENEKKMV